MGGAVLVESQEWTKTTAAKTVLEKVVGNGGAPADFLMVVGDGRDDEPVFSWANELATNDEVKSVTTVKVGTKNTQANATITGVAGEIFTLSFRFSLLWFLVVLFRRFSA